MGRGRIANLDACILLRPETERVVFTVYAPPGIAEKDVLLHLDGIRENVAVVAPGASVDSIETLGTD